MRNRSGRKNNRFDVHHDSPQGPNGGNRIDLTDTSEGDRVLATMRSLGHTTIGEPELPAAQGEELRTTPDQTGAPTERPAL